MFYNRLSASSHTRGHRFAPELTAAVLAWIESHGRQVLNGGRALQLELSQVAQYEALRRCGIRTPITIAAVGRRQILEAARRFAGRPFIQAQPCGQRARHSPVPRCGGACPASREPGLRAFGRRHCADPGIHRSTRAVHHAGRVHRPRASVRRAGRHLAGIELCPADACEIGESRSAAAAAGNGRFRIIADFDHPLQPLYRAFLRANDVMSPPSSL